MKDFQQGRARYGTALAAFTLVELLVVISIIALLISMLLPSLKRARDQAKAIKCGAQLHGLGRGLHTYGIENDEWIPGRNTTGLETWIAGTPLGGAIERLSQPSVPVQTYDWMTPILRVTTTLPANRAQRFRMLLGDYRCPAVSFKASLYDVADPPDKQLFVEDTLRNGAFVGISYLMPVHFQHWGYAEPKTIVGFHPYAPVPIPFPVELNPSFYEVRTRRYRSRVDEVGAPAEKVAVADGTRHLGEERVLTTDYDHAPRFFGSFTSAGPWWSESTAYGSLSKSRGGNIPLTYRHTDGIESLFFDGHVERLSQRRSRKIDYWYPRGGVVVKSREGSTLFDTYSNGYVIR
jgi:prepilin-type processing-associated H-X9-DG protein